MKAYPAAVAVAAAAAAAAAGFDRQALVSSAALTISAAVKHVFALQ